MTTPITSEVLVERDELEDEDFYNRCQAYRHAPDDGTAGRNFELLKSYIRDYSKRVRSDSEHSSKEVAEVEPVASISRERDELMMQEQAMRIAIINLLEWDKKRQFIIPYVIRDPLHMALKAIPTVEESK
jgi:hypothetical protein